MIEKTFKGIQVIDRAGMYLFFAKWDCRYKRGDKTDEHKRTEELIEVSPIGATQECTDETSITPRR